MPHSRVIAAIKDNELMSAAHVTSRDTVVRSLARSFRDSRGAQSETRHRAFHHLEIRTKVRESSPRTNREVSFTSRRPSARRKNPIALSRAPLFLSPFVSWASRDSPPAIPRRKTISRFRRWTARQSGVTVSMRRYRGGDNGGKRLGEKSRG